MNPVIAAIAGVVQLAAVAFGTWKVLTRIRQAVQHLEQHLQQPEGIIEPGGLDDEQTGELRAAMDRRGFFAPNPREGS